MKPAHFVDGQSQLIANLLGELKVGYALVDAEYVDVLGVLGDSLIVRCCSVPFVVAMIAGA